MLNTQGAIAFRVTVIHLSIGTLFSMFNLSSTKKLIVASLCTAAVAIGMSGCDGAEKPSKMVEGRAQMMKQREEMKKTYGSTPVVPGSPQGSK